MVAVLFCFDFVLWVLGVCDHYLLGLIMLFAGGWGFAIGLWCWCGDVCFGVCYVGFYGLLWFWWCGCVEFRWFGRLCDTGVIWVLIWLMFELG